VPEDSTTDRTTPSSHPYIAAEQLQVGLHIFVDLPWFGHPFALNSFKISSEAQIRELRALGKARFRFDPDRSDTLSEPPPLAPPAPAATPTPDPAQTQAPDVLRLAQYRQRIEQVDKAFLKAGASCVRSTAICCKTPGKPCWK